MEKLCICLVIAVITNEAVAMTFRHKRQLNEDDPNSLEERYNWDLPAWANQVRQNPSRRPNQRPRPTPSPNQLPDENGWGNPTDNTRPRPTQGPNGWTTTARTTTTQSSSITACMNSCPVTSEYNPVCGTNSVTYTNPGRLTCAQSCGVNVSLLRASPCPTTTTASSRT